jgi:hypothetical protein
MSGIIPPRRHDLGHSATGKENLFHGYKIACVWAVCKQCLNTGKSFRTQTNTSYEIKCPYYMIRVILFTAETLSSYKQIKFWCAIHECVVSQDMLKSYVKAPVSLSQFIKATSITREGHYWWDRYQGELLAYFAISIQIAPGFWIMQLNWLVQFKSFFSLHTRGLN